MTDAPKSISELVALFRDNIDDYKKPAFNETQLRRQFLDPFFESLGWDVSNRNGYSENYKEVVHEDRLRDEGHRKAPDYSFRIGRERKFFVEAKKPSVNLSKDKSASYQLRRYAWSANLPLSLISNFAELSVYDTRVRPDRDDSPRIARVLIFDYTEYETRWKEIVSLLSKEAILKGAFDRFADRKLKKGTAPVDQDFLDTIESSRLQLAQTIYKANSSLSVGELSYTVQATIDRILFLRICEDKEIETYGNLKEIIGIGSYAKLLGKLKDAQNRYNSGLFHIFPESKSDKLFDSLSSSIKVPDSAVNNLLKRLYYPESPYEFSVISPDILGSVYERFLGSIISIKNKSVNVELKEELKKAGGVYYTPTNIVQYMVRTALLPMLSKQKNESCSIKVLDMACGSGSFLIQAYDELLEWYSAWHIKRGTKSSKYLEKVPLPNGGTALRLSLAERKRILLDHIYGADIDPQAVEVTKLALFLKLIEDSSVLPKQMELAPFQRRILPDMSNNIRCGNSILGHDVFNTISMDQEKISQHKPFDWATDTGFGSIMSDGGFDLIIGNPPYSYRKSTVDLLKRYYQARYESTQGNYDVYKMFLERGSELLRPGGTICQITNSSFLIQPQFQNLRQFLDRNLILQEIDVMGPNVFQNVTIDTAILCGQKRSRGRKVGQILIKEPSVPNQISSAIGYKISQGRMSLAPSAAFE